MTDTVECPRYWPLDDLETDILRVMRRASYDKPTFHEEVAPFLSPRSVDIEIKSGRLPIIRCGDRVAILAPDAARFLARLRRESG